MSWLGLYWRALKGAWTRFNTEYGWSRSSHVAMSMILALFPFCIFALSLAAQFGSGLDAHALTEFVFGTWPDEISGPITREVEAVLAQSSSRNLTIGALIAIFFASNGVDAVRIAITGAYREKETRPIWKVRLLCVVFVLVGALLLSVAGAVGVALPLYFQFVSDTAPDVYAALFSRDAVRLVITSALLIFAVCAAHMWLPGVPRPFRQILPGVILTFVLWVVSGLGFVSYLRAYASYSLTYAGLAGVMAALVFLYIMSAILVLGAEFNGRLARLRRAPPAAPDANATE